MSVGWRLRVDGSARTIVGVLPASFSFLSSKARVYLPLASPPEQRLPDRRHWGSQAQMLGRLTPGATLAEAQAQVDAHNATVERNGKDAAMMAAAGFRSIVVPLRADHVASVRPVLVLVQAGACFLLGIGIVNLVNLLLIRAAGRTRELAIRQAIGANRGHVASELVTEILALALPGGVLGALAGAAGIRLLATLGLDRLPLGATVTFDTRHAVVALAASVGAGLLAAVPVAWHNLRAHGTQGLQSQSRTTTASRGAQRLRHAFLVTQLALAFVLLAGAGLLAVSLERVMRLPTGFQPDHLVSAQVVMPWRNHPTTASRLSFIEQLTTALAGQAGVRFAGAATNIPLSGNVTRSAATVAGSTRRSGEGPHAIYSYGVDGDYFAALGLPLREGRVLDARDSRSGDRPCVVDDAFARREFPDGRVIGRRLFMGGAPGPRARPSRSSAWSAP